MSTEIKETLFNLVVQANSISQALCESGGELTPQLEALMAHVDTAFPAKVESYHIVMERMTVEAEYWKEKASVYLKIAKAHDALQERLKASIKDGMIALGKDEVMGESIRFKLSPTKGALVISDETKLPDEYLMIETKKVPDKEKIRASLEAFATVPGASLEGGYRMSKYTIKGSK